MAEKNNSRELSIKVGVDVAEALTGLKAIQREAKKATQALRELEAANMSLTKIVDMDGNHTLILPQRNGGESR